MRKAVQLNSLEELNLSPRTRRYLERNFQTPYGVIQHGRQMAYDYRVYSQFVKHPNKATLELIFALEEGGFTHSVDDLTQTMNVNRLYKAVYDEYIDVFFENIRELSVEGYEDLHLITDDEFKSVAAAIDETLDEEERLFMLYRYGLTKGGLSHTFNNTKSFFNLSRARAAKTEADALKKLRVCGLLPPIFDSADGGEDDKYVDLLIRKLNSLSDDDDAQFREELTEELKCMAVTPFKCSRKAQEYLKH